jgi:hypothetical protein
MDPVGYSLPSTRRSGVIRRRVADCKDMVTDATNITSHPRQREPHDLETLVIATNADARFSYVA